jgi:hypothetical protein
MSNNLRTASQQALEALQASRPLATEDDCVEKVKAHEAAITALRAALAQPQVAPAACAMRHAPVWTTSTFDKLPHPVSNFACKACGYVGSHDAHPGCKRDAAPQTQQSAEPRQPLTDEQMLALVLPITHDAPTTYLALCYESGPYSVTKLRSSAIALIRAVERAHGITGEKT